MKYMERLGVIEKIHKQGDGIFLINMYDCPNVYKLNQKYCEGIFYSQDQGRDPNNPLEVNDEISFLVEPFHGHTHVILNIRRISVAGQWNRNPKDDWNTCDVSKWGYVSGSSEWVLDWEKLEVIPPFRDYGSFTIEELMGVKNEN